MRMKKIPVSILGATGSVGQKFIQLLSNHPYFVIESLVASERSAGKKFGDAVNWILPVPLPSEIASLVIKKTQETLSSKILFSGLDSSIAGEVEEFYANKGHIIISNSKNHRFDEFVPLLIPEVNHEHLELIRYQNYGGGAIITNPNCSTIGLAMSLKPIIDNFGLSDVNVVTMQALSGAGYPGVSSLDILDNVIPFISGEEEKLETEPKKIFGKYSEGKIEFSDLRISAQCNRVAVMDGHLETVQVKLKNNVCHGDIIEVWKNFSGLPQKLNLPSAPKQPIYYFTEDNFPQPRIHRNIENGMAVSIGRLRKCNIFDFKFSILSHNTVRGAAGGSILCAELLLEKEYMNAF
ncbi:MAG: aspartate-semialdehyde dehydrogenase [Ignavibacteriaceae bacterium]|nr:aspartate-semialdehyde dehydrogenase [Ignavibacteriaceae bacterium]